MDLVKTLLFSALAASVCHGADFSLTFGPPVAAYAEGVVVKKGVTAAVRADHCAAPHTAAISGTAEGIDKGTRKSLPLVSVETRPGVFAILANWPANQKWLLVITATCGAASTSATVGTDNEGPIRETAKTYAKKPTATEVEADLKALSK